MLDTCQRRSTCATRVATDEDVICVGLCNTRCNDANADFAHEFDTYPGTRIAVLQIVDQLGKIFDRCVGNRQVLHYFACTHDGDKVA